MVFDFSFIDLYKRELCQMVFIRSCVISEFACQNYGFGQCPLLHGQFNCWRCPRVVINLINNTSRATPISRAKNFHLFANALLIRGSDPYDELWALLFPHSSNFDKRCLNEWTILNALSKHKLCSCFELLIMQCTQSYWVFCCPNSAESINHSSSHTHV